MAVGEYSQRAMSSHTSLYLACDMCCREKYQGAKLCTSSRHAWNCNCRTRTNPYTNDAGPNADISVTLVTRNLGARVKRSSLWTNDSAKAEFRPSKMIKQFLS